MATAFRPAALPALGLLCAGVALAPTAGAAPTVKVPIPAPGHVAVAAAPVRAAGTLVAPRKLPGGTIVTGGIAGRGAKRVVLVAAVRPKDAKPATGSLAVTVKSKAKPGRGASTARLFAASTPANLAKVVKPSCRTAPKALGHTLRRTGAAGIKAVDVEALSLVIAGRLCSKSVDPRLGDLLSRLGLLGGSTTPGPGGHSTPPPPAGGSPTPSPPPGGGSTPPPATGTPACSNGKDDDGDGQVDDVTTTTAPFFDPGCTGPTDTTEDSEKQAPAYCGLGVLTNRARTAFMADFDSVTTSGCPKPLVKGVVDLVPAVATCDRGGFGGHDNATCTVANGVATVSGGQGDQWQMAGTAAADLCGTRAIAIGYTAAGEAWEIDDTIYDFPRVCDAGGTTECSDGVDNDDVDGQIDLADPGCTGADDTTEGSEVPFPTTGCWSTAVYDPEGDRSIAYIYVQPSESGRSCPPMTKAWISFNDRQVVGCATPAPYWGQTAAGTCTVQDGDAVLAGGSGTALFVALKLDAPFNCSSLRPEGQIDVLHGDLIHEAVLSIGLFEGDYYRRCELGDE